MSTFDTKRLPATPDVIATDGSNVRVLLGLAGGGMAHFELAAGETATAVTHRTVEEIWYFLHGQGEMWRRQEGREEVVPVEQLDDAVERLLGSILACGPRAVRSQKALIADWEDLPLRQAVQRGIDSFALAWEGKEPRRMMRSFLARRKRSLPE